MGPVAPSTRLHSVKNGNKYSAGSEDGQGSPCALGERITRVLKFFPKKWLHIKMFNSTLALHSLKAQHAGLGGDTTSSVLSRLHDRLHSNYPLGRLSHLCCGAAPEISTCCWGAGMYGQVPGPNVATSCLSHLTFHKATETGSISHCLSVSKPSPQPSFLLLPPCFARHEWVGVGFWA